MPSARYTDSLDLTAGVGIQSDGNIIGGGANGSYIRLSRHGN